MSDDLKPCPFCRATGDRLGRRGICDSCGAWGPSATLAHGRRVAWNTRPVEDELRAEVDRLREAIRRVPVDEIADRLSALDETNAWRRTTLYELREAAEEKR